MKVLKINVFLVLMLLTVFLITQQAYGCDTIFATGPATADGSTITANNNDHKADRVMPPVYTPYTTHEPGAVRYFSSGDTIPEAEETYAYISLFYLGGSHGPHAPEGLETEVNTPYWGVNEYGVVIGNNSFTDVWYTDEEGYLKEKNYEVGGPRAHKYDLTSIVLERAKTALEGVQIYGELVETCDSGGIGGYATSGGNGYIISGPDGAYLLEECLDTHVWGARPLDPIKEAVFSRSNRPLLGNSITMGSPDAEKNFVGTPRLSAGRATASRKALELASGQLTPEIFMRILSSRMGDNPVPEFDPSFTMEDTLNRGWFTTNSGIAWVRYDMPELLRVCAYMNNFFPGQGQIYGHVYLPFYVSREKEGIPIIAADIEQQLQLFQVIPGKEINEFHEHVFAAQMEMEEKAINLINEGKEDQALALIYQFEDRMVRDANALYEKHYVPLSPVRINVGGPEFTDSSGNTWMADQELMAVDPYRNSALFGPRFGYLGGNTISTGSAIDNTTDDMLYQTARVGRSLEYRINLPEGYYKATLKFAEIEEGKDREGARLISVTLNRTPKDWTKSNRVIRDFDIYAAAGFNTATEREYMVGVRREPWPKGSTESMQLKITLKGYECDVLLSGIEVVKVDDVVPFWQEWWKPEEFGFVVVDK